MLKIIRLILAVLAILLVSIFGTIYFAFRPFRADNVNQVAGIFKWIGKWIVGLRFTIVGEENHAQGGAIYISNHQSNLDVFVGCTVNAPNIVSLGKNVILYYPLFGLLYWLTGNILINRSNKKKAIASMQKVKRELHEKHKSIWIMPEGTRNKHSDTLLPFKKGAFITAIQAEVPIIPCSVSFFRDQVDYNKWISARIFVKIHPPISTQNMNLEDKDSLMKQCRETLLEGISEMDQMSTTGK